MLEKVLRTLVCVPLIVVSACGGDTEGDDVGGDPAADAAPQPNADAASGPDAAGPTVDAGGNQTSGTLVGKVTRSVAPTSGGKGPLYIAVFTADPVTNMAQAMLVSQALIPDVDMSPMNASIAYTVPNVPPRAEAYSVIAFLDDNQNVDPTDPTTAKPDKGDLVSLNGLAAPTVTVPTPGDKSFDLVLNAALPF